MGKDVVRQTVNMPEDLVELARQRWEAIGCRSFTDYVDALVRSDLAERPVLLRSEEGAVFASVLRPLTAEKVAQLRTQRSAVELAEEITQKNLASAAKAAEGRRETRATS